MRKRKRKRKKMSPRARAMIATSQMNLKKSKGAPMHDTPRQCSGWRIPWGKGLAHIPALEEFFRHAMVETRCAPEPQVEKRVALG
jgi:hypothetical protein